MRAFLVGAALAISATPAAAQPAPASGFSKPVKAGQGCPALAPINRWAAQWARHEEEVSLEDPSIFCGDFDGDGRADALAFINYNTGGNSTNHIVTLFRNANGQLQHLRTVDDVIGEPASASFARGRVALDMITLRPSDPRCCPSGRTRIVVNVATEAHTP
jgi:hypothetical protein